MKKNKFFFMILIIASSLIILQAGIACAAEGEQISHAAENIIDISDAEKAVGKALVEKGAGEHLQALILGQRQKLLYSGDKPMQVEVKGLQFDKGSSRWSANLLFVSDGQVVSAIPAMGRFQAMVKLPTLKHPVKAGETISKDDIEMAEFPQPRLQNDFVDDVNNLIGKSPRRMIASNHPIRVADLSLPTVLKKNAMVQITYKTQSMEISTAGQALDAGAPGDVITVKNLASKSIVRAVVQDDRTVSVVPMVQSTALLGDSHVN